MPLFGPFWETPRTPSEFWPQRLQNFRILIRPFLGDAAEHSAPVGNTAAGKGKDYFEFEISDVPMPGDLEGKKQLSYNKKYHQELFIYYKT